MSTPVTGFQVGANINPFEASMRRLVDAARSGQAGVGNALGSLASGPLAGLQTAFQGIAAVLAGGFLQSAISSTAEMTESAMDLSRSLGISTNEAKAVQMAMEDIGASTGEYEGAAKGLTRQLRENEAEMNKMGLKTRDAAGHFRPMNELVLDGIKVLEGYKSSTDRGLASQVLFGRGVDASSRLMLYNRDVLAETKSAMDDLGLTVGANATTAWAEYDAAMDRAGFGVQGLKKAIGDALMPVMTTLVQMLNAVLPAAIVGIRGALGGLTTLFLGLRNGVVVLWETLNAFIYSIVEPLRGLAEALFKTMTGDFSGAAAAFKAIGKNVGDVWEGAMSRMAESSRKTAQQVAALFSKDDVLGSGGGSGAGTKNYTGKEKPQKEQSQMAVYEAELAKKIAIFEREAQAQGTLRQYSKKEEAAYWREVSQRAGVSAEDKARAEKKWRDIERGLRTEAFSVEMADLEQRKQAAQSNYAERISLAEQAHAKTMAMYGAESKEAAATFGKVLEEKRKQLAQLAQLEDIVRDRAREKALADLDFEKQDADHSLSMGLINQEERLAQQSQFEEKSHAIKLQYLQKSLEAVDPQKDPVRKAEIDAQIEQLELQHRLKMAEIANQTTQASTANLRGMADSVSSSWASSMQGVMNGTMTMAQGIRGLFKGVVDAVIGMLAQMAAKWMVQQLLMKAFGKALTAGKIGEESAKAGAGGVASMAAAPFPLNLSAPAFGSAMAAAAMAFAPIASASQGFDIPRGLNPLTQLHEEEMVLPAKHADVIRNLADEGQGATTSGDVHLHVNAVDAQSVARLFRDNGQHLVAALQQQRRNLAF